MEESVSEREIRFFFFKWRNGYLGIQQGYITMYRGNLLIKTRLCVCVYCAYLLGQAIRENVGQTKISRTILEVLFLQVLVNCLAFFCAMAERLIVAK